MSIKIGDLELNKRNADDGQGTIQEIKSVRTLAVGDKRKLLRNKIASTYGSIVDDLGRHAMRIALIGEFVGEGAKQGITTLRAKYRTGEPLQFLSDMTLLAQVGKVLIEDLKVRNLSGIQNRYEYYMILREYKEPPQKEKEAPGQDQEAEEEAAKEGDIHDIEGTILDFLGNPVKNAPVIVKSEKNEYKVSTNEKGAYWVDDVDEGVYTVTVDHTQPRFEEFADVEDKVEVRKVAKSG